MCDTFVALPLNTSDGAVLFGKNSVREPNEAQVVELHPAQEFQENAKLQCTYLEIPQVRQTNAILISRPFWMWGAEIGANDRGVVIGNEAVFSKMPMKSTRGLTGMDLLRLGLERSSSAENALEIIVELLAENGQGGNCGYESKLYYHNSYIIADKTSAWVLETAGPLWVAKQVKTKYSISNRYSIGEQFDLSHPDLIETARKKKWLKKGQVFNFAACYSDWFYTTFSGSRARQLCSSNRLSALTGAVSVQDAFSILRDHAVDNYQPDSHFLMNCVCTHSANPISRHSAQSTSSLVAELTTDEQTFWVTGTAAPCTSIFKPFRFGGADWPEPANSTNRNYDEQSMWWRHEILHRTILKDFQSRLNLIIPERDHLEESLIEQVRSQSGNISELTAEAFETTQSLEDGWLEMMKNLEIRKQSRGYYRHYWKKQSQKVGMTV